VTENKEISENIVDYFFLFARNPEKFEVVKEKGVKRGFQGGG
jgi:hypothetical protein